MRKAERFLDELMNHFDEIYSVYLIDNDNNLYNYDRLTDVDQYPSDLINFSAEAQWRKEIKDEMGGSIFSVGGDDLYYTEPKLSTVACVRVVNDLENQQPIGVLVINVDKSFFESAYSEIVSDNNVDVYVRDKNGRYLGEKYIEELGIARQEAETHIIHSEVIEPFGFEVILSTRIAALDKGYSQLNFMAIGMVLFNSLILFAGSAFMASRITRPIFQLNAAMKAYHKEDVDHVYLESSYPEFKMLQNGYNRMMADIKQLFDALKQEQKVKRKAELKALQAQIKPHFLYNTFDSVCALALMEDHESVYDIMMSLGQFYKLSLSGGNEVITLADELDIVKHYLAIQRVRYPDLFDYKLVVEEGLEEVEVLKLVLQPIVENALYHGLKPKKARGLIKIDIRRIDKGVKITVSDNGVGMSGNQLFKALNGKNCSFGLSGTIERLKIYTGNAQVVYVESQVGLGTAIHISLPYRGGETYVEDNEGYAG